jgi:hypothetical protein
MKKILFFALLATISGIAFSQQTYSLQFNPKEGDKYDATTTTKSTIVQSMMGQDMTIVMNMNANMLYEIAKANGNSVLNWTYQKLGSNMEMMGQSFNMSSEENNPESRTFKALKGAKFSIVMNNKGEVLDIKGIDDMNNRLSDFSDEEKEAVSAFINPEALKGSVEMEHKIFPPNAVKIGDTWTGTSEMKTLYTLKLNNTYKLVKVENGSAFIELVSKVSTGGAQTMTMQGMEADITLDGDMKASLQMDIATGMVTNYDVTQNVKGQVEVQGMEIPMSVKTEMKTTLVKK